FTARRPNYSYFPILLERDCALSRDDLYAGLKSLGIHPRRYFFPLVVDFPDYQHCRVSGSLRNAKDLSERVLCLPMHAELPIESVERVCDAINTLTATRHSKPEH
ncbi:MAG: dTDP-4-amino-4,6-dideoxygalactose transaminase, partial [Halieaceae bacterium]